MVYIEDRINEDCMSFLSKEKTASDSFETFYKRSINRTNYIRLYTSQLDFFKDFH